MMIGCSCVQAQVGVEVRVEAELRSHSAWRTDDETPPTTKGPSQSGIQQISRTALSATHATPTIRKSPRYDMENNKNSSSRLPFSNSKTRNSKVGRWWLMCSMLRDYLAAIGKEDDPQDRSPPANVTVLRAVADALDLDHAQHGNGERACLDLCIIGFFWMLRPAKR